MERLRAANREEPLWKVDGDEIDLVSERAYAAYGCVILRRHDRVISSLFTLINE